MRGYKVAVRLELAAVKSAIKNRMSKSVSGLPSKRRFPSTKESYSFGWASSHTQIADARALAKAGCKGRFTFWKHAAASCMICDRRVLSTFDHSRSLRSTRSGASSTLVVRRVSRDCIRARTIGQFEDDR